MIIEGKAYWAKLLKPGKNYAGDGEEYTVDLSLEDKAIEQLTEIGLGPKVKPAINPTNSKEHIGGKPYIKFVVPTKTRDGKDLNGPIVVDEFGKDWDPEVGIGNGSTLRVRFKVREGTFNGRAWIKPAMNKVQVWEHEPYEDEEDFDYAEGQPMAEEEAWD